MRAKKPTVALIYDFDGILSTGNIQEFGFIKALGQNPKDFWEKNTKLSFDNDDSPVLCYMNLVIN